MDFCRIVRLYKTGNDFFAHIGTKIHIDMNYGSLVVKTSFDIVII